MGRMSHYREFNAVWWQAASLRVNRSSLVLLDK